MRGLPFIHDLNKEIFSKSTAIGGRFYVCPKMGNEINTEDLDQVIQDLVVKPKEKKYPLVLMMPPVAYGPVSGADKWRTYHFILFFLKTSYYNSVNQTSSPNVNTGTSTHTILQDWHDMDRCAENYMQALDIVQRGKSTIRTSFRLDQGFQRVIRPVSIIGKDRASGVRLDYRAAIFSGCELEDYTLEGLGGIVIPTADSHPEHNL